MYYVGLLQRGHTAVYQYRTSVDLLSPSLLRYYGPSFITKKQAKIHAKDNKKAILSLLNDQYPNKHFISIKID